MAKRNKWRAFEEHLLNLVKTSPQRPFTSEEVLQILTRYGEPPDWAKQPDDRLIARLKEMHARKLTQAEAHFRDPSQIRSLGALFESTLTIKNIFISQLAQAVDMTVEEIEDYVENRLPARRLSEAQMKKLAELTGIAIAEIRRIANETAKRAETPAAAKSASAKYKRPYPMATDYSAVGMIREEHSKKYGA
jgi:hypothetical protein